MKRILVFAGSNSKESINKELATYVASFLKENEIKVLDLNDYSLPLYSIDEENKSGIPKEALAFYKEIGKADGIILSLAEHNGNFTVAFKNLYDWMSRIEQKLWQSKPMLLMATSPGARGGANVLDIAKSSFSHMGGAIVSTFSLPKFYDNYNRGQIADSNLLKALKEALVVLNKSL